MSLSTLLRWSGFAALVGYGLDAVSEPFAFFVPFENEALSVAAASNLWFAVHLLGVITLLLGLVGVVGLYARQAEKAGILGLIAFLMMFFGTALYCAWIWMETFVWPILAHAAPRLLDHPDEDMYQTLNASQTIHLLLYMGGLLLFSVASLRASVFPRWAAVLVLVGAVLGLVWAFVGVIPDIGQLFISLGLAWMGYVVWSHKRATTESIAPLMAGGPSLASH
jgi:hypothetical protein